MIKYIEKYKSQALYFPSYYKNKLDVVLHTPKYEADKKRLEELYPKCFLFKSPEMTADFVEMDDPTQNPLKITISSKEIAKWKCHKCGCEWSSKVFDQANRNNRNKSTESGNEMKCPICFKKKKSLANKYPKLCEIYDENINEIPLYDLTCKDFSKNVKCTCNIHGLYEIKFGTLMKKLKKGINPCCQCANKDKLNGRRVNYSTFEKESPELCLDWSEKNNKKPSDFSYKSDATVIWKCHVCGYEWKAKIFARVNHPSCPNCRKRKSLIISDPEVYHKIKPIYDNTKNDMPLEERRLKDEKSVVLTCPAHGDYRMTMKKLVVIIKNGTNPCKFCDMTKKTNKVIQTFADAHPELVDEWSSKNSLSPDHTAAFSRAEVIWKCKKCGYEWTARVMDRSRGYKKCPNCYPFGKKGKRLSEVRPDLRKYYSDENIIPFDEISSYDTTPRVWVCDKGHKFMRTVASTMKKEKFVCRMCNGTRASKDDNIESNHPDLMKEWDYERNSKIGYNPAKIKDGSSYEAYWKCRKCGGSYKLRISRKIQYEKDGIEACPYCSGREANGENNITVTNPEILEEWDYNKNEADNIDPHKLLARNGIMAHWICPDCGSHYDMTVSERVQREENDQTACPYCRGSLANETNCLATTNPDILDEWDYEKNEADNIDPHKLLARNKIMAHWICPDCGSHYDMRIKERVQREENDQLSCPYCRGWLVNKTNCLATTKPEVMKEWYYPANSICGLDPNKISERSSCKAWWKCPRCGYIYPMAVNEKCLKSLRKMDSCMRCKTGKRFTRFHFV